MGVELIPVKVRPMKEKFDLFHTIVQYIDESGQQLADGDILVVSSKFVSVSQGNIVALDGVEPGEKALKMADKFSMDPRLAELVVRESDFIFGGVPGFVLAVREGVVAPNAGIDRSNVQHGYAILHPREPFEEAEMLRRKVAEELGRKIGVVITDSRLMPTRVGTIGVAIGAAGFEPVEDLRGKKDLFGNPLRVTFKATADSIATAANMIMGESDESIPVVIVRNLAVRMSERMLGWRDLAIPHDECIYVRGLGNSTSDPEEV